MGIARLSVGSPLWMSITADARKGNVMTLAPRFLDRSGTSPTASEMWDPLLVPKELLDKKIDELASAPVPDNGLRRADIVHPSATEPGLGLAPGIRVSLDVLLPGEQVELPPSNASDVNFSIQGSGTTAIAEERFHFDQYDVWVRPALTRAVHRNDSDGLQVRLTYSNAPVLEKLNVHFYPGHSELERRGEPEPDEELLDGHPFGDRLTLPHPDGRGDIELMSYEKLISPDVVEQMVLHWPWASVESELVKLAAIGPEYRGRRLYLLYNPATGRTNGTTNNFFATMTIRPPKIVDRPHRHASAAINYFFRGRGDSVVGGKRYEWKAGDLMLTAPGWMVHRHASHDEPVYELTIQDSPFHLAQNSLLWQENLKNPLSLLGSQTGFSTNRAALV